MIDTTYILECMAWIERFIAYVLKNPDSDAANWFDFPPQEVQIVGITDEVTLEYKNSDYYNGFAVYELVINVVTIPVSVIKEVAMIGVSWNS